MDVPKPFQVIEKAKIEVDKIVSRLELKERIDISGQLAHHFSQNLTLRAAWDNFRAANWLEIIDYPELTLQQTQALLAITV